MKKITVLFVLMLAAGYAFSQISLGPKVGFNTSQLTADASEIKDEMSNSFNFGVFLRLGKKIYIQPEVNWLTRGGIFKSPEIGDYKPINQEIEMKTIEIPLLLGWRIVNFGVGNVRLMVGPSASIVMDKTVSTGDESNFYNPIEESNLEDMIWGFNAGVGVDVLMFTLDVRYQMGLNEVLQKVEKLDLYSKSNVFAVSLGWKII